MEKKESTRQVAAFAIVEHDYYLPLEEDDEESCKKHNTQHSEYWGEEVLNEFCDKYMNIDSESLVTRMFNCVRVDNDRVYLIKIFDFDKETLSSFGPDIIFEYFENTIKTLYELDIDYKSDAYPYRITRYYNSMIELLDIVDQNRPEATYLELDYPIQFYRSGLELVKKIEEARRYKPDVSNEPIDYDMQDIHKQFNEFFENYMITTITNSATHIIYTVIQIFFRMIVGYYNDTVLNPAFQIK